MAGPELKPSAKGIFEQLGQSPDVPRIIDTGSNNPQDYEGRNNKPPFIDVRRRRNRMSISKLLKHR